MTDTDTTTETDALRRLRELKTRLDMARGEGVSGSGFIRALGGHADGFESCQANDAIELLVPQLKRAIDAWQAERDGTSGNGNRTRGDKVMNNTLGDLNNYLFAEIERLDDEGLRGDDLAQEISRAHAIGKVAQAISFYRDGQPRQGPGR
jgi:hypothetical protein